MLGPNARQACCRVRRISDAVGMLITEPLSLARALALKFPKAG